MGGGRGLACLAMGCRNRVLAALVVEIVRSLSHGDVGLDLLAALSMSAALALVSPSCFRLAVVSRSSFGHPVISAV
jgi:hypothetical protein